MSTPFTRPTAQTRAGEFLVHLIEALSGRAELKIDMRSALGRLEELLNTQRSPRVREPLLAMYLLWHRLLPAEVHRPTPASTMAAAMEELQRPSMYSFAAGLLLGETPLWSVDELCELAEQRYGALHVARPVELPSRPDAALWVCVAKSLLLEGAHDLACAAIGRAVDCSAGHEDLMALERAILDDQDADFDVRTFLLGTAEPQRKLTKAEHGSMTDTRATH